MSQERPTVPRLPRKPRFLDHDSFAKFVYGLPNAVAGTLALADERAAALVDPAGIVPAEAELVSALLKTRRGDKFFDAPFRE